MVSRTNSQTMIEEKILMAYIELIYDYIRKDKEKGGLF